MKPVEGNPVFIYLKKKRRKLVEAEIDFFINQSFFYYDFRD
jgi:hypothetical protein